MWDILTTAAIGLPALIWCVENADARVLLAYFTRATFFSAVVAYNTEGLLRSWALLEASGMILLTGVWFYTSVKNKLK